MIGSAAETFRKEQPAVFRQIGKNFSRIATTWTTAK